jgi:hypothetical protein
MQGFPHRDYFTGTGKSGFLNVNQDGEFKKSKNQKSKNQKIGDDRSSST